MFKLNLLLEVVLFSVPLYIRSHHLKFSKEEADSLAALDFLALNMVDFLVALSLEPELLLALPLHHVEEADFSAPAPTLVAVVFLQTNQSPKAFSVILILNHHQVVFLEIPLHKQEDFLVVELYLEEPLAVVFLQTNQNHQEAFLVAHLLEAAISFILLNNLMSVVLSLLIQPHHQLAVSSLLCNQLEEALCLLIHLNSNLEVSWVPLEVS